MKIIFIGCVRFSQHCLNEVLKCDGDVLGIVTRHDDGRNADHADLSAVGSVNEIPVFYSDDLNDEATLTWIKELNPDVIFCFGWSQLIKEELLSIPPMGVLGAHPSMLPKNRGRHPIIWALVLGLTETGLTFFFMNTKADAGPILAQKEICIADTDTALSLYDKIESTASILINDFMPILIGNVYEVLEQDESQANTWRKRNHSDGVINWEMSAKTVFNLVRALTKPYVGAEFVYKNKPVKLWSVDIVANDRVENAKPGRVVELHKGIPTVRCQEGAVRLLECEPNISLRVGEDL